MNLTPKQRSALVGVSDEEWRQLVPMNPRSVVQRLYALGLVRCDHDHLTYEERYWVITPDGLDALEATQ